MVGCQPLARWKAISPCSATKCCGEEEVGAGLIQPADEFVIGEVFLREGSSKRLVRLHGSGLFSPRCQAEDRAAGTI